MILPPPKATAMDPRAPIYDPNSNSWQSKVGRRAVWLAPIALAATAFIIWQSLTGDKTKAQATLYALAAAWAIGAPVWFAAEFHLLYRKASGEGSWEVFKHGQQVAVAVWAGVAAGLYAVGSSDLAKPAPDEKCFAIHAPAKAPGESAIFKLVSCNP